jgi:hypothetical protein
VSCTHEQVLFSPSSLRHWSSCFFGRKEGSWYSSGGDEEVDTELYVSPLLDDEEVSESDKTTSSVERRCNDLLFLLTSYNVWAISDQSTSAEAKVIQKQKHERRGREKKQRVGGLTFQKEERRHE